MKRRSRIFAAVLALLLLVLLTGCSKEEVTNSPANQPPVKIDDSINANVAPAETNPASEPGGEAVSTAPAAEQTDLVPPATESVEEPAFESRHIESSYEAPETEPAPVTEAPETGVIPATEEPETEVVPDTEAPVTEPPAAQESYDVEIWVPEEAFELTWEQIAAFNRENEYGVYIDASVYTESVSDAPTQMLYNLEYGADLYFFAQDQCATLVRNGALSPIPEGIASAVRAETAAGALTAAMAGDTLYAYPATNDNGYFMYYDKSVIPQEHLGSLEALIADCEAANMYFAFEQGTSAWYMASFFFGAGCRSEWITDEYGNFVSFDDDFFSDKGLIAVKGMEKLVKSYCYLSASSVREFESGAAIVVSGTWDYNLAESILGDNLGAAELPCFEVDGISYHLGSFSGCKLLGVKPQADSRRNEVLHLLAQYLTSEEAQLTRFNQLNWGPANSRAAANQAVLQNPAMAALLKQNEYAVPMGQIEGAWWDIAKVIAYDVEDASCEADLMKALQSYSVKLNMLFGRNPGAESDWSLIGTICGTYWDADFPMEEVEADVYRSGEIVLFKDEEFKFRKNGSWDVNFGADGSRDGPNLVVEHSGRYTVTLHVLEGETVVAYSLDLITPYEDELSEPGVSGSDTWSVIGSICGTMWDTDFPMTYRGDGIWVSDPMTLYAGDELKCRMNNSWDENYGADGYYGANYVVTEDGQYVVVLDLNNEFVYLAGN